MKQYKKESNPLDSFLAFVVIVFCMMTLKHLDKLMDAVEHRYFVPKPAAPKAAKPGTSPYPTAAVNLSK